MPVPSGYLSPNPDTAAYGVLTPDPPIFHLAHLIDWHGRMMFRLDRLYDLLGRRPAVFLCSWYWHAEERRLARFQERFEKIHRRRYPQQRFVHLCNTDRQREVFEDCGLEAVLCNHNAFVDERLFFPISMTAKRFDAIYDARLVPYKRHQLATEVERLALIHELPTDVTDWETVPQLLGQLQLPNAVSLNKTSSGYRRLTENEVNESLNQCRVGLALSAVEGAMYASIQYLLAGLPVVTTTSQGGRDLFFEHPFTLVVDAQPGAVREGVTEMIGRDLSPHAIRSRTLQKMAGHRRTLCDLVDRLSAEYGVERRFVEDWDRVFFNKLLRSQRHDEIPAQLSDDVSFLAHFLRRRWLMW